MITLRKRGSKAPLATEFYAFGWSYGTRDVYSISMKRPATGEKMDQREISFSLEMGKDRAEAFAVFIAQHLVCARADMIKTFQNEEVKPSEALRRLAKQYEDAGK
jgi:hypothetical protein